MSSHYQKLATRVFRFGIVGLTNTFLTFSLFSVLVLFGTPYKIGIVITSILGVLFSSLLNKSFTFGGKGHSYTISFIGIYVIIIGLNLILIEFGVKQMAMDPIVVQAILVLPLAGLTFILLWVADSFLVSKRS